MALISVFEFGDHVLLNSDHIVSVEARKSEERSVLRIHMTDDRARIVHPVTNEGEILTEAQAAEKGFDVLLRDFTVYVSKMNRF